MAGVILPESKMVAARGSLAPRKPGILIVDDMALMLALLKRALEPRGYAVWLAEDGETAIDLYRRNAARIDVVLLDVQMPGMDGPQTLAALRQVDPGLTACFMTRAPGAYTRADLLLLGAVRVFEKPFRPSEVAESLDGMRTATRSAFPAGRSPRPRRRFHAIHRTD